MDAANEWTEAQLEALEKRMAKEYRQAFKELKVKHKKFMAEFEREKSQRLKAMDDTPEARKEYRQWLASQAARADWMNGMVSEYATRMTEANKSAVAAVRDDLPGIYAENANFAAYDIEKGVGLNLSFTLVDEDTVRHLMKEDPKLLPDPKVNVPKDQRWNKQKFTSAITQGVLQGESIPDIAKRLQSVCGMNYHSACGIARLAVTGAENAGRVNSYERAKGMGIDLKQEWLATLDGRTRHSHRQLDGEKVEVGEKFSNGCRFPGDPDGPASEIYGCRCTLIASLDDVGTSDAERWSKLPEDITYEEWQLGKQSINEQKQNQHIEGTSEWANRVAKLDIGEMRPSVMTINLDEIQELVNACRGTGERHVTRHNNGAVQVKETCSDGTFGIIGIWRNKTLGVECETDAFTIHYSQTGTHVVPSAPTWFDWSAYAD